METFSALLAICAGNSPVTGEFPAQRPVTRSFDVFFHLHLNKRLSKQWSSRPIWRHCNDAKGLWCRRRADALAPLWSWRWLRILYLTLYSWFYGKRSLRVRTICWTNWKLEYLSKQRHNTKWTLDESTVIYLARRGVRTFYLDLPRCGSQDNWNGIWLWRSNLWGQDPSILTILVVRWLFRAGF